MTKQKMNQQAVANKFIHGWLPTQVFLHQQHHSSSACCPVCANLFLPETTNHIVTCPHPRAKIICTNLLSKCLKHLCNIAHTSPIILNCWDECLCHELGLAANMSPGYLQYSYWIETMVHASQCHQNIIGWEKFFCGTISM